MRKIKTDEPGIEGKKMKRQGKTKIQKLQETRKGKAAQGAGKAKRMQKPEHMQKPSVPGEWLYLAPEGVTVRQIAESLNERDGIELWEEAGVLELELHEGSSMDMERAEIHPKDEVTSSFVEKNGCKEVFLVTFAPEEYACAEVLMRQILSGCGGLFCGDTEDFTPVVR